MLYFTFSVTVASILVLGINAGDSSTTQAPETCPDPPVFTLDQINGTWFEYKRTTDFIGKGACTQFRVNCDNQTYCQAVVIESPENYDIEFMADDSDINATIYSGKNKMPGVHIKVGSKNDSVLLWQCETKDNETDLMYQASIWYTSKNPNDTNVEDLISYLPSVVWDTVNQTCTGSASIITFGVFNILCGIILSFIIY